MALSATFTANFSSFFDAVAKADIKLKDFGTGADQVGKRLGRMADSFSGAKIIQDAQLMVRAIGGVEGVAKLTEKELARVAATTNEAVEKMQKLGKEVPKDLQAVADATKGANTATTDWMGSLTKMAGAIGIVFSVDAIKTFIGSIFDAASAIGDMADQWGVSTTAVQQWTGAAKQSGVSAESVGRSLQFLTENLGEASTEYDALLKNVGLSGAKLRDMPLEDAYKAVLGAIAGIEDETLQLDVAIGLLGPSARKMIGALRDGFLEAADAQKVMSEETIKRLKEAEAQWKRFGDAVTIFSADILGNVIANTKTATSSWGNFFKYAALTAKDGLEGVQFWQRGSAAAFLEAQQAAEKTAKSTNLVIVAGEGLEDQMVDEAAAIRTTNQILADLKAKEEAATRAQKARTDALAEATREQDAYNKTIEDYKRSISALAADFAGDDLIAKAIQYEQALQESIPIQQMTRQEQDAINKVMLDAIDVYHAAGREAPQAMWDIVVATQKLNVEIQGVQSAITDFRSAWPTLIDLPLPKLGGLGGKPAAGLFDGMAKGLAGSLSKSVLSAIQGGGNIFQAAGSSIGNFLLDPKQSGVGKAVEGAAKKLPGFLGGAISSAIPVVGSFIGPAVGWLANKITGWFGKKEYEKLRDGFVKSAGGISELRTAAEAAGISLDRLFAAKSTESVNKAIADINEQLGFQAKAYDVVIEAAERYGFTIEELGPAMARQELDKQAQQLYKDFEILNSAGIETVAITERMGEAVSDYVQDALAMGTEIPSAMRPMLESFAKAGTLIDANGNAITNLEDAGLSFSMTMSEGFKELIGEVKKLTDAISRGLGTAIRTVPDIEVEGKVKWYGTQAPSQAEGYARGTNGFKNFGKGTPVVLHGWEAVVPRDEANAIVSGGGGGTPGAAATSIVINAQGAFFDTPGDLQRLADKVNDALTAKFGLRNAMRAG